MAHRSERKRLAAHLAPHEEILASDPLSLIEERPELTVLAHPVLVVTSMSVFVLLSGPPPEVHRIGLDALATAERSDDKKLGTRLRLTTADGAVSTVVYEPLARTHVTADLITEQVAARTVADTVDDVAPSTRRLSGGDP